MQMRENGKIMINGIASEKKYGNDDANYKKGGKWAQDFRLKRQIGRDENAKTNCPVLRMRFSMAIGVKWRREGAENFQVK